METNSTNLFQPKPSLSNKDGEVKKTYKEIKAPNVGVVEAPNISKTPLGDKMLNYKNENPRMKYKLSSGKVQLNKFNLACSFVILACSVMALFNGKENVKPDKILDKIA